MASTYWSDLPLDILLIVKSKLQDHRLDLMSFRSVCSQWRSAMPAPARLPSYRVEMMSSSEIKFIIGDEAHDCDDSRSMVMSFSSPVPMFCTKSCNSWLVYNTPRNDEKIIHLVDPVSNLKLELPPLSRKRLYHENKLDLTIRNASVSFLQKVQATSGADGSIAVAAIIQFTIQKVALKAIVFYRVGYGKKWKLLMETRKDIQDIAVTDDDRFYAIVGKTDLYVLDERPPSIRLRKLKLWLPRQILESQHISFRWMEGRDGSPLKICGYCGLKNLRIVLKLKVTNLCDRSNNANVTCEAEWCPDMRLPCQFYYCTFTPSLRNPLQNLKGRAWKVKAALLFITVDELLSVKLFIRSPPPPI